MNITTVYIFKNEDGEYCIFDGKNFLNDLYIRPLIKAIENDPRRIFINLSPPGQYLQNGKDKVKIVEFSQEEKEAFNEVYFCGDFVEQGEDQSKKLIEGLLREAFPSFKMIPE